MLCRYGAHPSTQHSNERVVKIASRAARSEKSEKVANMYLIASNGFVLEYIKEEPENNQEGDADSMKEYLGRHKRIRGKTIGGNKLVEMEKHLIEIEHDLTVICKQKGNVEFNAELKLVTGMLESSDKIKIEKDSQTVEDMVGSFDEIKSNAKIQRKSVGYVLPLFDEYVKETTVCASKNLQEGGFADLEFQARNYMKSTLLSELIKSEWPLGVREH